MTQLTKEEIVLKQVLDYFNLDSTTAPKALYELVFSTVNSQPSSQKFEAALKAERERAGKLMEELRDALEGMIYQYGYRTVCDGQPAIGTGGMSALEHAFGAIGWADDPHIIPKDGNTCEIQGCMQDPSSGQRWGDLYLSLCSDHSKMLRDGKDRPDVKDYAIKREATRDKVTGCLPFKNNQ